MGKVLMVYVLVKSLVRMVFIHAAMREAVGAVAKNGNMEIVRRIGQRCGLYVMEKLSQEDDLLRERAQLPEQHDGSDDEDEGRPDELHDSVDELINLLADWRAIDDLRHLLSFQEPAVRRQAARALGAIEYTAEEDKDKVREALEDLLKKNFLKDGVTSTEDSDADAGVPAQQPGSWRQRQFVGRAAAEALGEVGDANSRNVLAHAIKHPDSFLHVFRAALAALRRLFEAGDANQREEIAGVLYAASELEQQLPDRLCLVVEVIAELKHGGAALHLRTIADQFYHSNNEVLAKIAEVLPRAVAVDVEREDLRNWLRLRLHHDDGTGRERVREAMVSSLGEIGTHGDIELLEQRLDGDAEGSTEECPEVRAMLEAAIKSIREREGLA